MSRRWRFPNRNLHHVRKTWKIQLAERALEPLDAWQTGVSNRYIRADVLLDLVRFDARVTLLDMSDTVRSGRESDTAYKAHIWLLRAATMRSQVVLEGAEKLEVDPAILADGIWRCEVTLLLHWTVSGNELIVADCRVNLVLGFQFVFLPVGEKNRKDNRNLVRI